MDDRSLSVSLHTLAAALAWMICGGLMALFVYNDHFHCAALGLAMSAVAATLSIKCFCIKVNQNIMAAFELGRESGRAEMRPLSRL